MNRSCSILAALAVAAPLALGRGASSTPPPAAPTGIDSTSTTPSSPSTASSSSSGDAPPSLLEAVVPGGDDPLEPVNRVVAELNFWLLDVVLQPLGRGYRYVVPAGARCGVTRFFQNLRAPVRIAGNLLMGEGGLAWHETKRFAVNTTRGILGFLDPATEMGLPETRADVGVAFQSWGWDESSFVMLPVFGPSNVRDTLALPLDALLDPASWLFPASAVRTVNDGSDTTERIVNLLETQRDPYTLVRWYAVLRRDLDPETLTLTAEQHASVETLGATYLAPKDPEFHYRRETHEARLDERRALPYDLYLAADEAPLVVLLPGLAGHRASGPQRGLAELALEAGCSALTIGNAMNWEFMAHAATSPVPGYVPQDVADVARAIRTALADVRERHPGRVGKVAVMGLSLGAFHALWLAANEDDARFATGASLYVGICPPVSLEHGLAQLDRAFDVPLALPAAERAAFVQATLQKAVAVVDEKTPPGTPPLPFTADEAEFLVGLAFRLNLCDVILASQERFHLGVLRTRRSEFHRLAAYEEAARFSWGDYVRAFVFEWYRGPLTGAPSVEQLLHECDLRRLGPRLEGHERVRVFMNENDFLLAAGDADWLEATLGSANVRRYEAGGHLGNLHEAAVQAELRALLSTLRD